MSLFQEQEQKTSDEVCLDSDFCVNIPAAPLQKKGKSCIIMKLKMSFALISMAEEPIISA